MGITSLCFALYTMYVVWKRNSTSILLLFYSLVAAERIGFLLTKFHGFFSLKNGFEKNLFAVTSLIFIYSRSGFANYAGKIFHSLAYKDVRCLNFMILEYDKASYQDKVKVWNPNQKGLNSRLVNFMLK